MLGQQFIRSGDHSCDKGQISTDHQLFWSLIKSTDDLWSTCDRLEPQSGELSLDPRKYSAKNGFWCNPRSSLIRERYFEKMLKVRCFDAVKRIICRIPVCCFPPQYLPCRKYIDFTQTQDFFLCGCDDWNGSFSTTYLPVFCVYLGMLIHKASGPPPPPPNGHCLYQSLRLLVIAFDSIILLPLILIVNQLHPLYV